MGSSERSQPSAGHSVSQEMWAQLPGCHRGAVELSAPQPFCQGLLSLYHAQVGLQFQLQALEDLPALCHLLPLDLQLLHVDGHLLVQLLGLEGRKGGAVSCSWAWQLLAAPELDLTCFSKRSLASWRFFSASSSYWVLIFSMIPARSTPGAASTSTLTEPPTCLRSLVTSCSQEHC